VTKFSGKQNHFASKIYTNKSKSCNQNQQLKSLHTFVPVFILPKKNLKQLIHSLLLADLKAQQQQL